MHDENLYERYFLEIDKYLRPKAVREEMTMVPMLYQSETSEYINIPENAQVIDIINESMTMDITYAFNTVIYKNQTQLFWYHTVRGDDPASMFERTSSYMPPILEELYTTFSNHD